MTDINMRMHCTYPVAAGPDECERFELDFVSGLEYHALAICRRKATRDAGADVRRRRLEAPTKKYGRRAPWKLTGRNALLRRTTSV